MGVLRLPAVIDEARRIDAALFALLFELFAHLLHARLGVVLGKIVRTPHRHAKAALHVGNDLADSCPAFIKRHALARTVESATRKIATVQRLLLALEFEPHPFAPEIRRRKPRLSVMIEVRGRLPRLRIVDRIRRRPDQIAERLRILGRADFKSKRRIQHDPLVLDAIRRRTDTSRRHRFAPDHRQRRRQHHTDCYDLAHLSSSFSKYHSPFLRPPRRLSPALTFNDAITLCA